MSKSPWTSGPGEILRHGLALLRKDSDTNRRLAMLSIDNSVELMIKTYLGLPKRVTGLKIGRARYAEFCESFPKLLDAMDEFASEKAAGIDLGEIEWYHRLRNQLYHQGNGLTVELEKVVIYAELAKLLFKNLFGQDLEVEDQKGHERLIGGFLSAWVQLEKTVQAIWTRFSLSESKLPNMKAEFYRDVNPLVEDLSPQKPRVSTTKRKGFVTTELVARKLIDERLDKEIGRLRQRRNGVVHGETNSLTEDDIRSVKKAIGQLETVLNSFPE